MKKSPKLLVGWQVNYLIYYQFIRNDILRFKMEKCNILKVQTNLKVVLIFI